MESRLAAHIGSLVVHGLIAGALFLLVGDKVTKAAHDYIWMEYHQTEPEPQEEPPQEEPPEEKPAKEEPPEQRPERKPHPRQTQPDAPPGETGSERPSEFLDLGLVVEGDGSGVPQTAISAPTGSASATGSERDPKPKVPSTHPAKPVKPACTEPVVPPRPLQRRRIDYPSFASERGLSGRLVVEIAVDAGGAIEGIKVVSPIDPELDEAIVTILREWTFQSATKCGKPVAGSYRMALRFEAEGS